MIAGEGWGRGDHDGGWGVGDIRPGGIGYILVELNLGVPGSPLLGSEA